MFKKRPIAERRPVVGWEGIYEVSRNGKVFRIIEDPVQEITPNINHGGYCTVGLRFKSRREGCMVHRLVAKAFIPNPYRLPHVNHKDFNTRNNWDWNLAWCTPNQNNLHSMNAGRWTPVQMERFFGQSKPVIGTHLVTGEQIEFKSIKEAGRHGFLYWEISRCCRDLIPSHKDYVWRYKD